MERLHAETDYGIAMGLVLDKEFIEHVRNKYKGMNPKVLLTAFLIKNFPQEMDIPGDHALTDMAKGIVDAIMSDDMGTLGMVYPTFFEDFNKWRARDIHLLKSQIILMRTELDNTKAPDIQDEADQQWNDSVDMSKRVLSSASEQLDLFASSPPKFN